MLRSEPDATALAMQFKTFPSISIGAPTVLECSIVMEIRTGLQSRPLIRGFLAENQVNVVSFLAEHAALATEAYHRFGKGRHPAALNYGDCMTYAIAKMFDAPILCVGDDFAKTDVAVVDWKS